MIMTELSIQALERELAESRQTIADLHRERDACRSSAPCLLQSAVLLEAMLETSSDHFLVMDMEHRLIFANRAFRDLFFRLYNHDLQRGDNLFAPMPPEMGQFWENVLASTHSSGELQFDQQYFPEEGRCDIQWYGRRVLGKEGVSMGAAMYGRDITALRMTEKALRARDIQLHQAQKMEAVGALAAGAAHEFNNTLSIVLGNLELSLLEIQAEDPARAYLEDAKVGVLRAKKVARQLVNFSRKASGRREQVDVHTVVANALSLLRASIPSHIEFHQHIETCPPVSVEPTLLHQMMINLCTNAADAMEAEGGVMTVTLEHITLKGGKVPAGLSLSPGAYAKLTVADNGCGMSASTLDHMYEPFFTTKGPGRGMGLGLTVVRSLVDDCGGCITAHSRPGRGSKFEVYLPTVIPAEPRPAEAQAPATLEGCERILFIDDEPRFVILTQRQLERMGYQVEIFTSSVRALERFQAAPDAFDLVITDVAMPKMTGEQLVNQMRRLRPALPVIFCTGYSQKVDQQSAALMGCEYLVKPVEFEDLARLIRMTLDRREARP
jgi:signal transduction histidine kinase/ActR/RegA family two-component response regulator